MADEIIVKIYKDGDKYCAVLGKDLENGIAGFHSDPITALRHLADKLESHIEFAYDNKFKIIGEINDR